MSNSSTNDPWTMYQRVREVGRGAHGFALLCKRRKDNSSVVIKELFGGQSSKEAQAKSMSEIQFLSIVRHPNIIAYFDCFTAEANQDSNNSNARKNTKLYIVMEYADGGTLDSYLGSLKNTHLDESQVLYFFSQIAFALHHIHSHSILHRDMKTNNIMISGSGNSMILKIGDFGISKFLKNDDSFSDTVVVGTPSYLSPELCDGKSFSEKSDIWAMGCILYEIMALHRMFEGSNLPALVIKITSGKYKPLPNFYSENLANLVASCTNVYPEGRPNTKTIMGMSFLQDHLLKTQMTIGRLSLSEEFKLLDS